MANANELRTIDDIAVWLSEGMRRPSSKFLRDMLKGIHASKSIKLANIARALGEGNNLHSTCNRLGRNLADPDLERIIADRLLEQGANMVKRHTRLIVNVYTVAKPNARKMQYLQDGDENTTDEAQFLVCEILASNTGSGKYSPLLATLWSRYAPGYVSDAQEILDALGRVLKATKGRGVVCLEYRYIPPAIVDDLLDNLLASQDTQFICTEGSVAPVLVHRQQNKTTTELAEVCDLPYWGRLFKVLPVNAEKSDAYLIYRQYLSSTPNELSDLAIPMEFGSLPVRCQESGRPVSIIIMNTYHPLLGERSTRLVTSYEKLNSRKKILAPIHAFLSLGDVVAAHGSIRDSYNPSDLQVAKYDRMQLLMTFLLAVVFFEARTYKLKLPLARFQPHEGRYRRDYLLPEDVERLKSEAIPVDDAGHG